MNCPFLWLRMPILLWKDSFRLLSSKKCRFYWRRINQQTFTTFFFCWSGNCTGFYCRIFSQPFLATHWNSPCSLFKGGQNNPPLKRELLDQQGFIKNGLVRGGWIYALEVTLKAILQVNILTNHFVLLWGTCLEDKPMVEWIDKMQNFRLQIGYNENEKYLSLRVNQHMQDSFL